ncbi:MAG: asparagine synthase (glutamine-hydrolyzing), partial [Pirellulales bacterium]
QPMASADGRHALVYNGELYEHRQLRQRLAARGAKFRTRSDTEVLLAALTLEGEDCLPRLNGMFAFALADCRDETLLIARDPLGIKPLYYYVSPCGDLVFASELPSLLLHPQVPRRLDWESLAMLLVDRYVADPWTLFAGVRQLPPGHLLRWKAGRVDVRSYCHLMPNPTAMEEHASVQRLDELLDESVRAQMEADVPVGVLLSGGIDSGTVAALACRNARRPVKTFSVGFAKPEYDESGLARQVARHLGTDHHELRIGQGGFDPDMLDLIIDHVGQPLADISCIPMYLVSRFARDHVKVVLSGDGGDELFGGYEYICWAARIRRASRRIPWIARRFGVATLMALGPLARGRFAAPVRRARKGLTLTFCEPRTQLRRMLALWNEEQVAALFSREADPAKLRPPFPYLPVDAERTMSPE